MWREPVGVGVIGHGFMGKTHIQCYLAARASGHACELRGIAATSPIVVIGGDAGGNISRREGGGGGLDLRSVRLHGDYREMLRDPAIELVSVCTPTPTHGEIVRDAIGAGKRVLVEKPVALSSRAIAELARADTAGRVMPAMCMRFWPGWMELRAAIVRHRARLRSLRLRRVGERPGWSAFYADNSQCGGALFDLHLHDTDFVCHAFGLPERVESAGHEDNVTTRYEFGRGGAEVMAVGAWIPGQAFQMQYAAEFEHGRLTYDIGREPAFMAEGEIAREFPAGALAGSGAGYSTGYDGEIIAALGACRGGVFPVTLTEAAEVARVVEAERESLRTGRGVAIERTVMR